jgi:hypothetical protein
VFYKRNKNEHSDHKKNLQQIGARTPKTFIIMENENEHKIKIGKIDRGID